MKLVAQEHLTCNSCFHKIEYTLFCGVQNRVEQEACCVTLSYSCAQSYEVYDVCQIMFRGTNFRAPRFSIFEGLEGALVHISWYNFLMLQK